MNEWTNVRRKCDKYFFKGSMGCWNKMKMMKQASTTMKGINIILTMELENYEDKCDMMMLQIIVAWEAPWFIKKKIVVCN